MDTNLNARQIQEARDEAEGRSEGRDRHSGYREAAGAFGSSIRRALLAGDTVGASILAGQAEWCWEQAEWCWEQADRL